ncbi:MAG: hypothetical protein VCB59_11125, partial [Gammaproteobacteria bacterium]
YSVTYTSGKKNDSFSLEKFIINTTSRSAFHRIEFAAPRKRQKPKFFQTLTRKNRQNIHNVQSTRHN